MIDELMDETTETLVAMSMTAAWALEFNAENVEARQLMVAIRVELTRRDG